MICKIISYDIANDRCRNKVAKKLIYYGYERIQFSVFVGKYAKAHWQKCYDELLDLIEKHGNLAEDKLLALTISERELEKMNLVGKELDLSYILNKQVSLWI